MREFQDKKRLRNILYSPIVLIALVCLIVFFAHATWGVYQKERDSAATAVQAQAELTRMEDRNAVLTSNIQKLSTDEGVEEEIRQQFGVAKPGENMIIIVGNNESATTDSATSTQDWWQKMSEWFK